MCEIQPKVNFGMLHFDMLTFELAIYFDSEDTSKRVFSLFPF